jgi:hypothetical protein
MGRENIGEQIDRGWRMIDDRQKLCSRRKEVEKDGRWRTIVD